MFRNRKSYHLLKCGKCCEDGNPKVTKIRKMLRRTEILTLLKYEKMLQTQKSVTKNAENVTKTEILEFLKYGKCYEDGNPRVTKMRKIIQKRKS